MENLITIWEKDRYGSRKFMPKNEQAKRLALLVGAKKELSSTVLEDARAMGFIIRIEIRPEEV